MIFPQELTYLFSYFHINSTSVIRLAKWNKFSMFSIEINEPLPAPYQCFLDQFQVQQPTLIEKKRSKAKYLMWNSTSPEIVKKTSLLNPVESIRYIKCHGSSSPRPIESPSNFIRYNCQKIYSWSRRPKTILEIRKKTTFR